MTSISHFSIQIICESCYKVRGTWQLNAPFMENKLIFFCNFGDLKKKEYIIKFFEELKDELIIFLDKDKNIKVFSSICSHSGGEIFYDLQANTLQCKWHGWKFCINSGKCLSFPIMTNLNPYDFKVKPNNLTEYQIKKNDDDIYLINYE